MAFVKYLCIFCPIRDSDSVAFSCLSHTGPLDSSGPFLSRFCLSNTPPTADMSSSNQNDPNTPGKELKPDLPFLLFCHNRTPPLFLSPAVISSQDAPLRHFLAHVWDCFWVRVQMNEWMFAGVCLSNFAIKPCSVGMYVDISVAAHPVDRAWMPYPSSQSSPLHSMPSVHLFLLGKCFRRFLFR